eukprot:gene813-137_t
MKIKGIKSIPNINRVQPRNYCSLQNLKAKMALIFIPVSIMIFIRILDMCMGGAIAANTGIIPRTVFGMKGIFFSWLSHVGWGHLLANLVGYIGLGFACLSYGNITLMALSTFIILSSGFSTWCMAREANHIGCSGVVFGYFGFCVASLFWERPIMMRSVFVTIFVMVCYGNLFFGFGFCDGTTSWEAHLTGFFSGILFCPMYFKYFQKKWDILDYRYEEYANLP